MWGFNREDADLMSVGKFSVKKQMSSTCPSFITTIVLPLNKAFYDQQMLLCATDKTVFVLGRFHM